MQTIFARIIPAVDHLIALHCLKRNITVFAIWGIRRMKMANARKFSKSMNVKWETVVQLMQIALMLNTGRGQWTTQSFKTNNPVLLLFYRDIRHALIPDKVINVFARMVSLVMVEHVIHCLNAVRPFI